MRAMVLDRIRGPLAVREVPDPVPPNGGVVVRVLATAYRALTGRARLTAREWVTVIGAGGVGLSAVMIAKALGARVIAVGSEQTCADSVLSLRRRGRHVQVGLLPQAVGRPRVPMARVIGWELASPASSGPPTSPTTSRYARPIRLFRPLWDDFPERSTPGGS